MQTVTLINNFVNPVLNSYLSKNLVKTNLNKYNEYDSVSFGQHSRTLNKRIKSRRNQKVNKLNANTDKKSLHFNINKMIQSENEEEKINFCFDICDMPFFILGSYDTNDFRKSVTLLLDYIPNVTNPKLLKGLSMLVRTLLVSNPKNFDDIIGKYQNSTNPKVAEICKDYYANDL